ncbi:MAG: hypothetical protein ACRD2L_11985 [Terriglobia bacterium]
MATEPIDHVVRDYTLQDILKTSQAARSTGGFRRVLGAIAGGAANIFAPGIGSMIGGLIAGKGGTLPGLGGEAMQYLEFQRQMQAEVRAYETAVTILKLRHDSEMSALRATKG